LTGLAVWENRRIDSESSGVDIRNANQKIRAYNSAAIACYATAGMALTAYLIWTFRPHRPSAGGAVRADTTHGFWSARRRRPGPAS
jgi:hypothetical protein